MAARKQSSKRKQPTSTQRSSARKSASSRKSTRQPSDALALLRADHQTVQGLFDQFEKTRSEDRKAAIAEQICNELTIHAQIEEEIFYPAAREAIQEEELLDEATVEHASAKDLIAQIEGGSPGGELFDAKVKVLGEYVKHHVKEEQNELFPQVRKAKLDLKELGQRLQERKTELMESGGGRASTAGAGSGALSGSRRSGQPAKTTKRRENEGIVAAITRGIGLGKE
jgi:hemerythrin superfamily protein